MYNFMIALCLRRSALLGVSLSVLLACYASCMILSRLVRLAQQEWRCSRGVCQNTRSTWVAGCEGCYAGCTRCSCIAAGQTAGCTRCKPHIPDCYSTPCQLYWSIFQVCQQQAAQATHQQAAAAARAAWLRSGAPVHSCVEHAVSCASPC